MSWLQNDHYFFDQLHIRWLSLKKLKKFFSKFWRRTSIDHLTLSHIKVNIICGWNTFYKIFQKIFIKNFTKIFFLKFYWIFLIFSTQDGILMLISKWHIFFKFLAIWLIKVFLTSISEYAKNLKNTGHSVVSLISATHDEMAAKFSKNNHSLLVIQQVMESGKCHRNYSV